MPYVLYYIRRILVKSDIKVAVSSVAGSTTYEVPNEELARNNMQGRGDLSANTVRKITYDNPKRFYAL